MILRAAIVLLLMLNLGAAAWWWIGGDAASPGPRAQGTPGTPRLRLLSEAAPVRPAALPRATAGTSIGPLAASMDPLAPVRSPAPAAPPSAQADQCLRFGPFADAATRDAARPALAALASTVVARDTPGRASRGWWVFLPALPSREEARAVGERIKAAGIKDWYVMGEGDQANSIALGRYGGEEAARRREAEIRSKGFAALAAPLGARTPQWWLDARVPAGAAPAARAAVAGSSGIACTGLR